MGLTFSSNSFLNHQSCLVKFPLNLKHELKFKTRPEEEETDISDYCPPPKIEQLQKAILRESWIKLQRKMDAVGVVSFLRLFETHPETLRPFLHHINAVKEIEMDEWYREKLRVHALRVMAVVEKTMHRLDNEEKAIEMLSSYGKRHCGYGVTPQMLDLMGESFVVSFQSALEENWTRECEEAWQQLFKFIVHHMKGSYADAVKCPMSRRKTDATIVTRMRTSSASGCSVSSGVTSSNYEDAKSRSNSLKSSIPTQNSHSPLTRSMSYQV